MPVVAGGRQFADGTWSFTARAAMPDHQRLADDGEVVTLSEAQDAWLVVLRGERVGKRRDVRRITRLAGYGFTSEQEARRIAWRYGNALELTCATALTGLKWLPARDHAWPDIASGMRSIAEVHGSCEGEFEVRCLSSDALRTEVAQHLDRAAAIGEKIDLLLDVLMELPFDRSDRSRLLLAIALIELACTPHKNRSTKTVHSSECSMQISSRLGELAGQKFEELYKTRHSVAHRAVRGDELARTSNDAWCLAARFMLAGIGIAPAKFAV